MNNETSTTQWEPPFTLEEKLKHTVIPPGFFIKRIAKREWNKGERELRLLPFLVDRNKVSLDIGACWGVYTYYLAKMCPTVYTFEPNPKIFKILKRNAASNVKLFPYALSNVTQNAELRVPKGRKGYSNQGASLSTKKVDGEHGKVQVEAKRLDDLRIKNIGFIKIDVEGFEAQVIEGGAETIKSNKPNLLIEMEEKHTKEPIEESIARIEALGYETFVIIDNQLRTIDYFDAEDNHRNKKKGSDYIFNFIFLPKK